MTITPNPDVTLNQFMDVFINEFIPEYEKNFPGLTLKVLKGNRGENENRISMLLFDTVATRDKYWPTKDENSELAQKAIDNMQPTIDLPWGSETFISKWYGNLVCLSLPSESPIKALSFLKHIEGEKFRRIRDDGEPGETFVFERNSRGEIISYVQHNNYSRKIK